MNLSVALFCAFAAGLLTGGLPYTWSRLPPFVRAAAAALIGTCVALMAINAASA